MASKSSDMHEVEDMRAVYIKAPEWVWCTSWQARNLQFTALPRCQRARDGALEGLEEAPALRNLLAGLARGGMAQLPPQPMRRGDPHQHAHARQHVVHLPAVHAPSHGVKPQGYEFTSEVAGHICYTIVAHGCLIGNLARPDA